MVGREGVEIVSKILAAVSPYVKDKDPKMRMALSKTITRNILKALANKTKPLNSNAQIIEWVNREASQLLNSIDSTFAETQRYNNYSYTPSDANPDAKNTKIPPASSYGTFLECTTDLDTNYNVDPKISAEYCKSVNADSGQSGPSNIQGGGQTKKNIPIMPRTKQASVRVRDVAPWAICADSVEPDAKVTLDSGIRSASAVPNTWYTEDISSIMARKAELRSNKVETGNRLLSAKKNSEIPAWYVVTREFDE